MCQANLSHLAVGPTSGPHHIKRPAAYVMAISYCWVRVTGHIHGPWSTSVAQLYHLTYGLCQASKPKGIHSLMYGLWPIRSFIA